MPNRSRPPATEPVRRLQTGRLPAQRHPPSYAEQSQHLLVGSETLSLPLRPGRHAWVQVAEGEVVLNATPLREGDGAGLSEETAVTLTASQPAQVLLFDLA